MSHTAFLSNELADEMSTMSKRLAWARGEGVVRVSTEAPDGFLVDEVSKVVNG